MSDLLLGLPYYLAMLGILITAHEYGHYRVAVACNIRIYRFSLGFGPVLWRRPFGEPGCEFTLSAIPLGGYVLMLEKPDAETPPADVERALSRRPIWQRAAVILAGPLANLVLGAVFFAAAMSVGIVERVPALSEPPASSMLAAAGVRSGDRIVATSEDEVDAPGGVQWRPVHSFDDFFEGAIVALMDQKPLSLQIQHRGEQGTHEITLPLDTLGKDELDEEAVTRIGLTAPYSPAVVSNVVPSGPAARAGVQAGDLVQRIDDTAIVDAYALALRIRAAVADGKPRTMQWQVQRAGREIVIPVTPRITSDNGRVVARTDVAIGGAYATETVHLGPIDAVVYGTRQMGRHAVLSLRMFGRMLTGKASLKNLNGPITIADGAAKSAKLGLAHFLTYLAQVSVGIGVLNLLPIPVLDGGRLLYYLFEGATGRPVSTPWQTWLRYGGVFAILLLMSLALSNDLARLLGR
ncbi:MAG TPA: RIP metalloprotease RseP [Burkholderiaceae bacterium]